MNIEYNVQIWQEGKQFVAHSMPLDIMSSGETPEQARQALYEAVDLFLETAAEMGTLTEVLEECGYESQQGKWTGPIWIAVERHLASLAA
jgi:predicted RNase H-like HicB family nuclease